MAIEWDCCISWPRSGNNQPTVTISSITTTSKPSNEPQFFGVHVTEIQGRYFCSWCGREILSTGGSKGRAVVRGEK
jgi:hypothetical protein